MSENPNEFSASQKTGNENVITDYFAGVKKLEVQGYESAVKKARNTLFVTAAVLFIGEIITAAISETELTPLIIGIALFEAGLFVALALWTKKKPYTAIIVGLVLFIVFGF
jgi:hypothetical protein